jgi:hypothetical protein
MTNLWPISAIQPYKVQTAALEAAKDRRRFGFFLDPGLGKTLTTYAEFKRLYLEGKASTLLILCPKTLLTVWEREKDLTGLDLPVYIREKDPPKGPGIFLYNIEAVISSLSEAIKRLAWRDGCYVTIDESVTIKNFKSKRFKALKTWIGNVEYVRLLSGYPEVQNAWDWHPQLLCLGGLDVSVSNPYAFRNRYCAMGGWQGKQIVGTLHQKELSERINKVSFRARKFDWTDLPEKLYNERYYDLLPVQKKAYSDMRTKLITEIQNKTITVSQAVHATQKMQQIGSGFMYGMDSDDVAQIVEPAKNPKFAALRDYLDQTPGKVIIFAYYKETIKSLSKFLNKTPCITGGMTQEQIKEQIVWFNSTDVKTIVCQLTATKYGLTLLGSDKMPCHSTIYFENSYSLDARIQSEDRNHRYGQKNVVTYTDLFGTTVEKSVVAALRAKKMRADIIHELLVEKQGKVAA